MSPRNDEHLWQIVMALCGACSALSLALAAWTCTNIIDIQVRAARTDEQIQSLRVDVQGLKDSITRQHSHVTTQIDKRSPGE